MVIGKIDVLNAFWTRTILIILDFKRNVQLSCDIDSYLSSKEDWQLFIMRINLEQTFITLPY